MLEKGVEFLCYFVQISVYKWAMVVNDIFARNIKGLSNVQSLLPFSSGRLLAY